MQAGSAGVPGGLHEKDVAGTSHLREIAGARG